jgi:hypothetical protein
VRRADTIRAPPPEERKGRKGRKEKRSLAKNDFAVLAIFAFYCGRQVGMRLQRRDALRIMAACGRLSPRRLFAQRIWPQET